MSNLRTGHIVWRELMTQDAASARAFYEALLGWGSQAMEMPGIGTYTMHTVGEAAQGGYIELGAEEAGHPPHWMPYVSVEDLEATIARAEASGGAVVVGPLAAGEAGRFAVLRDPQGGHITAWRSADGDDGPAPDLTVPGTFCWEQLNTTDPEGAARFYGETFGWRVGDFQGMTTFGVGDQALAHVMPAPEGAPTHWLSHVVVGELGAARARAEELGATVVVDEIAVPDVGTLCVISDPQGAMISLFQPTG